jgi:hypothetical protein
MITVKDHSTGHLFDQWDHISPKRRKLLDRGWPGVFRKYLLEKLPVARIIQYFTEDMGRPSKELNTAIGVLILQQLQDISDDKVRDELAFNIAWHYALDITDSSDASMYISERTVRKYRQLVIKEGLDGILFNTLTDALIKEFQVDTSKQRLDSTHIQSNMRNLGRIRIFAVTIKKFLKKLARTHAEEYACLQLEFTQRYLGKDSESYFSRVKPSLAAKTLDQVSADLFFLIESFRAYESICTLSEYKLLERVLREQCTVVDTGEDAHVTVKPPKEVSTDSLQNPSDPDASYDAHKGQGYQVQLMETYQPLEKKDPKIPNLITHVEVEPAHVHDSHALQPAIDDTAQRDCCPDELLCDTLYGSEDNVQKAQEKGVTVIAPMPGNTPKEGFSLADFTCDPATQYVTHCPEDHHPQKTYRTKKNRLCANFPRETCLTCSRRTDCPIQIGKKAAYLRYDDAMLCHAQRRAHEETPEFRHKYRWRSGIEGTNSHLKSDVGTARLRVRGLPAVCFAATIKALGLNILRCARALAARFLIRIACLYLKKQLVKYKFSVVTSFTAFFVDNTGFYLAA